MTRVASLYLPFLAIERFRLSGLRVLRPDLAGAKPATPATDVVDDDPGACSVPRGGNWRPGARWARAGALDSERPIRRQGGRSTERAPHPFRPMPADEGVSGPVPAPASPGQHAEPATVLVMREGQRDIVAAACPVALELGLRIGMAVAHARALVVDLQVHDFDAAGDAAWLERLALHGARHWTPSASVALPDGLWLDLSGTTHLFGGEVQFCRRLLGFLKRLGFSARVAISGTPGAAHALARYGEQAVTILDAGREAQAIADLPLAALRLSGDALTTAARLGLERIADLYPMPRGPLARRLGLETVARLDQARGLQAEPIAPIIPFEMPLARRQLLEPIGTAEAIGKVIGDLVDDLSAQLRARGAGLRAGVLSYRRVDGDSRRIVIGTAKATRDASHLARMLVMRIDRIEPGFGIEAMSFAAPQIEDLAAEAYTARFGCEPSHADLPTLVDRLAGRIGDGAIFRVEAMESDVPERAIRRTDPLATPRNWPIWKRPTRLLARPELLGQVVALLPDHPPRRFTWRGKPYRVVAGDGPERIHGEWWRSGREMWAVRDYFQVEVETGERFWVFRRGDAIAPATGDLSWYMHGVFG